MKKAAIIGYGKSGKAAHKLLEKEGYTNVDIYDANESLGYKSLSDYTDIYDKTIVSPGIDLREYENISCKVDSEIELAYRHIKQGAKVIMAITGTNGKSTTTHLLSQILNNCGQNAVACGNIGLPFAEAVLNSDADVFALELSSFQLDLLNEFSVLAGAITNVTQDHLDRYGSMQNYYNSKLKIMDFIKEDGLLVADEDNVMIERAKDKPFDKMFISNAVIVDGVLDFGKFFVKLDGFNLFGMHNVLNLKYALILADKVMDFQGDVSHVLIGIQSMPHRTEVVATYDGVTYINDSKGTNVDSVLTALRSVKKPSVLMLGGRDKNSDFTPLVELIEKNVSEVIYFGEAREIIKSQLGDKITAQQTEIKTLQNAVRYCSECTRAGTTVLLSPACTSFDEFKSFEHRGEMFAKYVHEYAGSGR